MYVCVSNFNRRTFCFACINELDFSLQRRTRLKASENETLNRILATVGDEWKLIHTEERRNVYSSPRYGKTGTRKEMKWTRGRINTE